MYASGRGRGRASKPKPAPPPVRQFYAPELSKPADLERLLAGDLAGGVPDVEALIDEAYFCDLHIGVTALRLGRDFGVKDEHIKTIGEKLGSQLLCLELGSSDTGDGTWVSCAAVMQLVTACPRLVKLRLESVTQIDTPTFHAILSGCPDLEQLIHLLTGDDRSPGALKGAKALKPLMDGAAPALKRLCITDQWNVPYEAVMKLIKKRGATLQVQAGDTDGDSMASQMVMQAQGRSWGDAMYGNFDGGRGYEDDYDFY